MTTIALLCRDLHVADVAESSDGRIGRSVIGDHERDPVGEAGDMLADLVDETADALRFVVSGHHDGEMSYWHANPHTMHGERMVALISSLVESSSPPRSDGRRARTAQSSS